MVSGIFHALFGSSPKTSVASFFDFKDVKDIDGHPHDFTQYRGKVVIVSLNGELTVKRFHQAKGKSWLLPENPDYPPISLNEEDETHLWGVVTNVIHPL